MSIGAAVIPSISQDTTDRNRTSPFAFTGNKFEFRMVGSSDSMASSNTTLNTIIAEAFCEAADVLEKAEDFDVSTGFSLEMKTGRYDLGFVEYHHRIFRKQARNVLEYELVYLAACVAEQFGRIPFREGIFSYPFIGKVVVVVINMDNRYHRENSIFDAKLTLRTRFSNSHFRRLQFGSKSLLL